MSIDFIRGNPATTRYNDVMAREDASRRADNEEFRQRFQMEREAGADKGLRGAIGNYYAQQPNAAPGPAPAVAAPAAAPAAAPPSAPAPRDYSIFTGATPAPQAPPAAAVPAPAAAPVSAAPPAAQPRATLGAPPQSRLAPIISELAKTPGTGQHVMALFSADQAQQHQEAQRKDALIERGSKLMLDALGKNDVQGARMFAQQHGIEVPQEFWSNRQAMANLGIAANMAKTMNVKGQHAVAFAQAFAAHLAKNPNDEPGALDAAKNAVPTGGMGGPIKGRFVDAGGNVQAYDEDGNIKTLGKARPNRWEVTGANGRASNTVQNRNDTHARLKVAHPEWDEQTIARVMTGERLQPKDVLATMKAVAALKDGLGRPQFATQEAIDGEVRKRIQTAVDFAKPRNEGPAANPSPGGQPAFDSFFRNATPPQDENGDGEDQ